MRNMSQHGPGPMSALWLEAVKAFTHRSIGPLHRFKFRSTSDWQSLVDFQDQGDNMDNPTQNHLRLRPFGPFQKSCVESKFQGWHYNNLQDITHRTLNSLPISSPCSRLTLPLRQFLLWLSDFLTGFSPPDGLEYRHETHRFFAWTRRISCTFLNQVWDSRTTNLPRFVQRVRLLHVVHLFI